MSDTEMSDAPNPQLPTPSPDAPARTTPQWVDRPWDKFLASSFMAQDASCSSSSLPSFDDSTFTSAPVPIHPLLANSQFYADQTSLLHPKIYTAMQPAIRLATRFLTCGALDNFFYALYKNEYHKFEKDGEVLNYGLEIDEANLNGPPNDLEAERMRQSLRDLAAFTRFRVKGEQDPDFDCDACNKIQEEVTEEIKIREKGFEGWKGEVLIKPEVFQGLLEAEKAWKERGDTAIYIVRQFHLAVTLVHELAHAYNAARMNRLNDFEPFFGNEVVTELGFQLEKELFGGHIERIYSGDVKGIYACDQQKSMLTGALVLWEWPYHGQLHEYTDAAGNLGNGFAQRMDPRDLRPLDVAWRVPVKFIGELFFDYFWDTLYKPFGPNVLKPKHEMGYCFRTDDEGYVHPIEATMDDEKYVPRGYHRTTTGKDAGIIKQVPGVTCSNRGVGRGEKFPGEFSGAPRPWIRRFEVGGFFGPMDLERAAAFDPAIKQTWLSERSYKERESWM